MQKQTIEFECDCCGKKVYGEANWNRELSNPGYQKLPANWISLNPFGDLCDRCFSKFQDLYDRIHAPIRARQLARPVDEETFEVTPLNYFPEGPTFPS